MSKDFSLRTKIWIEKDGESILGPGRMELLEAIERTGSLTAATRECLISFRKAWRLINKINKQLEQPVVVSERGGKGGGGKTTLTEFGKKLIKQYRLIQRKIEELANDPTIWSEI